MIGIALVAFSAVLGAGHARVHEGSAGGAGPRRLRARRPGRLVADRPGRRERGRRVPGVEVATGLVQDRRTAFGDEISVDGVDEKRDRFRVRLRLGGRLGRRVREARLRRRRDRHGDVRQRPRPRRWATASRSRRSRATSSASSVAGIIEARQVQPARHWARSRSPGRLRRRRSRAERERYAFVAADGASRPALEKALASFPDVKLQSKSEFADRPVGLGGPDPRDLLRPPRPGRDRRRCSAS